MPTISLNGINMYYEQEGSGDPLVLIAGYRADLSAWSLIRTQLAEHFSLVMLDNRGAGRSDDPDTPYTIDTMADDVAALIKALGLHDPHVLGHSMGGAIAQSLAFRHPEILGKLILANTLITLKAAPAFSLNYFYKMRMQGMSHLTMFEGSMPWLFSDDFLQDKEKTEGLLQLVELYPYKQSLVGQKRQLEAILQFNSTPFYSKIVAPTLVMEGKRDIICPFDSERLAKGIPKAQSVTFSEQAHMCHIEKPGEFAEAILKFLKEA